MSFPRLALGDLQSTEAWYALVIGRGVRKTDIASTPGGAVTASVQLPSSGRIQQLLGWAIAETTGTATAGFRLHDGIGTGGGVLVRINLAANESTRDRGGPPGIWVVNGSIYLEVLSGSIEGVIFWI